MSPKEWLLLRLKATRAFSLPASVMPVVLTAAVVLPWQRWRWGVLAASAAGAGLLHIAGNLLNDYFDFRSGVDRKVEGDEGRPGRMLVRGQLRPRDELTLALACLATAAPLTLYVLWQSGPELLCFAGAAVLAIYIYTGPPLRLKYHALGEVLIFIVFGPLLMLGAAFAQTGQFEWRALLLSVPVGLATTAILTSNNVRDHEEDRSAGIRTIAHVFGPRGAAAVYLFLVFSAVLILAGLAALGLAPMPLLASPLLLAFLAKPLRAIWTGQRLPDIDARTAQFETVLLGLSIAAFIFWPR